MTEQESIGAYKELSYFLEQLQLTWIVHQVEDLVHIGKPVPKRVKTFKEKYEEPYLALLNEPDFSLSRLKLGAAAELTEVVAYTPQERLLLLIDAIEQAVVNTGQMEAETFESLERAVNHSIPEDIIFVSEDNDEQVTISRQKARMRRDLSRELKQLLKELRGGVYAN
jgi:hypothetical protein